MARPRRDPLLKTVLLCRVCGEEKGSDAYTPSDWRKYITSGECRACRSGYSRSRYEEDREALSKFYRYRREQVDFIKSSRGCLECGEMHPACLDFHHRAKEAKVSGIGTMVCSGARMDRILAEIEKCDVLCSNCHRKHHWKEKHERGDPKVIPLRASSF